MSLLNKSGQNDSAQAPTSANLPSELLNEQSSDQLRNNRQQHEQQLQYGQPQNQQYYAAPLQQEQTGMIIDYDAQMPIYSLNFSNQKHFTHQKILSQNQNENEEADFVRAECLLLGITSVLPHSNRVQIVEMCEQNLQIRQVAEIFQQYPATKIQWIPNLNGTEAGDLGQDFFATSSDVVRLYSVNHDQTDEQGEYRVDLHTELFNNSEYCGPITSFDWNQYDPRLLATASLDSTVTIWDLETQQVTTQLIAHDKAVYDISFAKDRNRFGTVGEDGSVRVFDTQQLESSTIIYESTSQPLRPLNKIAWNSHNPYQLAVIEEDSKEVLLLDQRKPMQVIKKLPHEGKANAVAWNPRSDGSLCTVSDDCQALIWEIDKNGEGNGEKTGDKSEQGAGKADAQSHKSQHVMDPQLQYNSGEKIFNLAWSQLSPSWVAIAMSNKIQTLKV